MELRHLRYFVAVAEELHFRKAAETLHIVQPALSKQISSLENELGLMLLERDRRHVTLTEAGKTFLEEAIAVLARADGAKSRAIAVSRGQVGSLNIGFIQPALAELVPRSLRRFRKEYPEVRIRLTELTTRQVLDQTMSRAVHCAFARLPIELREDLACLPISQQDVMLALPDGHPLAEQETVALADIDGEDLVMIDRLVEPALHDYYIAMCNEAGFSPHIAHEVNSTWVALGLIAGGLGVGFAPASARSAAQQGVTFRPIGGAEPKLSVGIVWNDKSKPAVLGNFLEMRPWEERS
ncbi:LysR substrate-binding domain-containing protein [Subtercola boreus]|uniref:LysR substrate-binding domain-containing protein n=1 Tax=Subtercola boreus TaxID=120213 RepID=UPI0011747DB6|nr:LysR substrate-binding domain-containing protein [Subtercola boreus]TQL54031.1 LysR family transcriptional regulator [Subtercola boreus]